MVRQFPRLGALITCPAYLKSLSPPFAMSIVVFCLPIDGEALSVAAGVSARQQTTVQQSVDNCQELEPGQEYIVLKVGRDDELGDACLVDPPGCREDKSVNCSVITNTGGTQLGISRNSEGGLDVDLDQTGEVEIEAGDTPTEVYGDPGGTVNIYGDGMVTIHSGSDMINIHSPDVELVLDLLPPNPAKPNDPITVINGTAPPNKPDANPPALIIKAVPGSGLFILSDSYNPWSLVPYE